MSLFHDVGGDEGRAEAEKERGREGEREKGTGAGAGEFDKWLDSGGQPVYLDLLFLTQSCTNQALKRLAIRTQQKPDNSRPAGSLWPDPALRPDPDHPLSHLPGRDDVLWVLRRSG